MDKVFSFFFGGWRNVLGTIIVIFGLCYLQWPDQTMAALLVGAIQVRDGLIKPLWPVLRPVLVIFAAVIAFAVMAKSFTGGGGGGGGGKKK